VTAASRATAHVDLTAISENVRALRARIDVPLMAVVKADAYGHGLIPSSRAALAGGATWLGVALLEEALAIRAAGIQDPRVMAWLTPPGDRFVEAINADIDLSVASVESVREIASAARVAGRTARVHLEVDTGMTRGGVLSDLDAVFKELGQGVDAGDLYLAGIWSHLASADQPTAPQNEEQRSRFEDAIACAAKAGLSPEVRHLANSAATLTNANLHYDLVRCGIACYGLSPDFELLGAADQWGLRPAMTVTSRLTLVKEVPAGVALSYGASYVMPADSIVAIVPMGYGDGVPRTGSNTLQVRSEEGFHPVRGRVCMDQIIIECGPASTLKAGDDVVLFGAGGPSADHWGQWSGSIGYEIVTRLGARVERTYTDFSRLDADRR
jgi:alanine racemase